METVIRALFGFKFSHCSNLAHNFDKRVPMFQCDDYGVHLSVICTYVSKEWVQTYPALNYRHPATSPENLKPKGKTRF